MISIPNEKIACEPIKSFSLDKRGVGFKTIAEATSLTALTVVYPSSHQTSFMDGKRPIPYQPGDKVYVRGDCKTFGWVKEVFDLGGQKVILVPVSAIEAWETNWSVLSPFVMPGMSVPMPYSSPPDNTLGDGHTVVVTPTTSVINK